MAAAKIKSKSIPRKARPNREADRSLSFVGGVPLVLMLAQLRRAGWGMHIGGMPLETWERDVRLDGRIVTWRQWDEVRQP